jgi:hypothetical protein
VGGLRLFVLNDENQLPIDKFTKEHYPVLPEAMYSSASGVRGKANAPPILKTGSLSERTFIVLTRSNPPHLLVLDDGDPPLPFLLAPFAVAPSPTPPSASSSSSSFPSCSSSLSAAPADKKHTLRKKFDLLLLTDKLQTVYGKPLKGFQLKHSNVLDDRIQPAIGSKTKINM